MAGAEGFVGGRSRHADRDVHGANPATDVPQIKKMATSRAAFVVLNSGTSITRDLAEASKELLGPTQSLFLDRTKETTAKLRLTPILQAVENSWGETNNTGEESAAAPEKSDHMGALTLAAAVEQGGVADERVKVETARLFVAGNAELISNNGFRLSEGVTMDVAVNALNWLLDREAVAGIPPKEKNVIFRGGSERLHSRSGDRAGNRCAARLRSGNLRLTRFNSR